MLNQRTVAIIFNPISGRGRARLLACDAKSALERRGVRVRLGESKRSYIRGELAPLLDGVEALFMAGGDGTLMALIPEIVRSKLPVYLIPSGNESLFARGFGMRADVGSVCAALESGSVSEHFYGLCNGRPFFSMASVGFDSEVIAHIARFRTGPIGKHGYALPVVACLLKHVAPEITLAVDGKEVLRDARGYLIVANSPEYASSLRLVPEADSRIRELCARFYPGHGTLQCLGWIGRYALGQPVATGQSTLFRGIRFEIKVGNPLSYPLQTDGEEAKTAPALIEPSSDTIRVLNPYSEQAAIP